MYEVGELLLRYEAVEEEDEYSECAWFKVEEAWVGFAVAFWGSAASILIGGKKRRLDGF